MNKILKVDNPNVYAEYVGAPMLHPQLALISYDEVSPFRNSLNNYGVYGLFIQQQFPKYLSYGNKSILVCQAFTVFHIVDEFIQSTDGHLTNVA